MKSGRWTESVLLVKKDTRREQRSANAEITCERGQNLLTRSSPFAQSKLGSNRSLGPREKLGPKFCGKRQMPRTKFNHRWTQMNADSLQRGDVRRLSVVAQFGWSAAVSQTSRSAATGASHTVALRKLEIKSFVGCLVACPERSRVCPADWVRQSLQCQWPQTNRRNRARAPCSPATAENRT